MIAGFIFCIFSLWLMWHTFSYDPSGFFLISTHVWSDFGAALPLIRSFSYGANWPPQHPLYPGLPIRYHFLFYLLVGFLEKAGLRIDFALNILSAFGFALLMFIIFKFSSRLLGSVWVGVLSIFLFLFNGSLSFIDYFRNNSLLDLPHLKNFVSFAPWNSSLVTAFWNLNIYTNQRHLGLSFGLALLVIYLLAFPGNALYLAGFLIGFLYFTNQAAFAIAMLFAGWYFLVSPAVRKKLLLSFLGLVPWLPFFQYLGLPVSSIHPYLGWLAEHPVTYAGWFNFWFHNFGLHLFLIPLGVYLAPRRAKILVVPLLLLFIVPNFFQLSTDLINNHKFFNFFLILGVMFSAYALYRISRIRILNLLFPVILLFTVAGGIVDFFPVINDNFLTLADVSANPAAEFFLQHTPPRSIVLNSTWFYHPASIAGRAVFNGYSYFTWSYGYDQVARERLTASIYASPTKQAACQLLISNSISYVELSLRPEGFLHPDFPMWQNSFIPVYSDTATTVYSVSQNCL